MAELANAIFEVFATLLRAIGFVGRPRQRAAIREDLALLRELEEFPRDEFGPGTRPHAWLADHINRQIAEFSGIDLRTSRRAIPWSSVVISIMIWAPLGWLTYHLQARGFAWWYVLLPAIPAGLMFAATLGMLGSKEEVLAAEFEAESSKTT